MPQPQEAILLRHLRKLATAQRATSDTDRDLLQGFIAGDEAAFAALVQRHGAMVLGVCRSVLGHQQDAEDVFQAAFLVLSRKAGAIRKQESLSSWLHGVAYRLALKARSQAGKRRAADVPAPRQPAAASPLEDLSVREWQSILHEELHRLPEKYRTPLLLCYWEGKTRDEAADQLGWARGTLKEQLERGRNLLRSRVVRRGLTPSSALFTALFTQNACEAGIAQALVQATAKAGVAFAGKSSSVGVISGSAAVLAEGALKAMQVNKWATTFVAIFFFTTLVGGIGLFSTRTPGGTGQAIVNNEQARKPALEPREPLDSDPPPAQKPKDLPAPAKDSDAGRWLNENLEAFELKLGMSAKNAPPPLILVTKEKDAKDGISADYFVVTKEEAASIVQTLVDSGLWGRPQEYASPPGPTGRFMTLTPTGWTWTLGRADEDVSSRFIIRHLLKISTGERETKLKAWLAHGIEAAPSVPDELKRAPLVRQVGEWHGGVNLLTPLIAMNGNQLAKVFEDKAEAARIAEKVDFEKERLVGFTWMGGSDTKAQFLVSAGDKGKVCAFMHIPGKRLNDAPNTFLYAVSNDVSCSIEGVAPPKFDVPIIREVDLGPFADAAQNKQLSDNLRRLADVQITDTEDLTRAFPDEPWQTRIAKQVDFAKQRLVVFSWDGRISDKFTPTILDEAIAPHVLFRLTPGPTKDERYRFHVYALARAVSTVGLPRPPKVFVRPFGVKAGEVVPGHPLVMQASQGVGMNPGVYMSAEAVAKAAPKELAESIAKEVDFKKERLVVYRQNGSAGDSMTFTIEDADTHPVVVCKFKGGTAKNKQISVFLYVVSNEASIRNSDSKGIHPLGWRIDPPDVKGGPRMPIGVPVKIASNADLLKMIPDKERRESIGFVDFDQSDLLYFAWTGPSDDKLTYHMDSGVKDSAQRLFVPIRYHPGQNRELADHHFFISVNHGAIWRLEGAPQPASKPKPRTRALDLNDIELKGIDAAFKQPTRIGDLNALAAAFPDKTAYGKVAAQVDFAKEYLLYFAWRGVGDDVLEHKDLPSKDGPIAFFRYHPGHEEKGRSHHRVFALPIGMTYRAVGPTPSQFGGVKAPREIELYMFEAPVWARDPSTPARITSAAEAARIVTDKTWLDFVAGRVNFDDEHLLFFAWSDNGGQTLSCKLEDVSGLPTAVFQHRYRNGDDKSRYVRLFVIPFNADWRVDSREFTQAELQAVKPASRAIDLKDIDVKAKPGSLTAPTEISDSGALARAIPDAAAREKIAGQVDFGKERLLFLAWAGAGNDELRRQDVLGKDGPIVLFRHIAGKEASEKFHRRLFALPFDMTYRVVEKPLYLKNAPPVRDIEIAFFPKSFANGPKDAKRITSAAELAKIVTEKAQYELMLQMVDFGEEHLLLFDWRGGGGEKLDYRLVETPKGTEAVFRHDSRGNDLNVRYTRWIAIPFYASWRVEKAAFEGTQKQAVRSITLVAFPNRDVQPGGPGAKMKSREDVELSFGKVNAAEILKRVDFSKEYLVLYSWQAALDERIVVAMEQSGEQKVAVFQHKSGDDKRKAQRVEMFGVPKEFTSRGETLRVPISQPLNTKTRELEILGFKVERPQVKAGNPLKITDAAGAAKVFTDKIILDKVLAQVDFQKEYLVYHAWVGAKYDQLSFTVEPGPIVAFHYAMGKNKALGFYHRLYALPNDATWRFEIVK